MKGIIYNRHASSYGEEISLSVDIRESWATRKDVIIPSAEFAKNFPGASISGKFNAGVKVGDNYSYNYTDEHPENYQIGQFNWDWSGCGVTEHWFDNEAMCLKKTSDYISGSGLTADANRMVAYKRHIEVRSFRGDCRDDTVKAFRPGLIWAE